MFTDNFVQMLQKQGLTAYAVAKGTGISQGTMGEYRSGKKKPSIENLVKIADFLGVSVDFLLGRTNNPAVNPDIPEGKEKAPENILRGKIEDRVRRLSDHQADLLLAYLEGLLAE